MLSWSGHTGSGALGGTHAVLPALTGSADTAEPPTAPLFPLPEPPSYSGGGGFVQHPLPQLINDTVHPITSKTLDTFI